MDVVLCVAAMLGMGMSLVPDLRQARTLDYVATDFKTLYASAALFAEGRDPYDVRDFARVYERDGVVLPSNTFGRMPVYPPVTLLVLAPLTGAPMGSAAAVWFGLSLGAMALGLAMVLREARARGLGLAWRLVIIGVAAGSPLLGFALNIGNVSVAVAGLAITAWMLALRPLKTEVHGHVLGGLALALACCLKPHVTLWVAVGIAVAARRAGRWIAGFALAGFVVEGVASLGVMAARGILGTGLRSLAEMLAQERSSGSMSAASREVLPIGAQITGLQSLFGLWIGGPMRAVMAGVILVILGAVLVWIARWLQAGDGLLYVLALTGVGMIATYHRAHDELVLMPVALWICLELKRRIASIGAWSVLLLLAGTWFAIPASTELLKLRQAALFSCCLACVLVGCAAWSAFQAKKGGTNDRLSVPGGQ